MGRVQNNLRPKYYKLTSAGRRQLESETKRGAASPWPSPAPSKRPEGSIITGLLTRLASLSRNLIARKRVERELDDEVRSYEQLLADEKIEKG